MKAFILLFILAEAAGAQTSATVRGTVTDPSGAFVPGALVQIRGSGSEKRAYTNEAGQYTLASVAPGEYTVRAIAKGFAVSERKRVRVAADLTLDFQLTIEVQAQVLNVEDEAAKVSVDPSTNASAVVLGEKELASLSDDPDELEQQLQALAGPAAGPNGGQIFIDGFSGGRMPPKSSIREVRINSNPYSPEYDRPGFGRIEIFTRPGTDNIRGQVFYQFNDESLNSRSPLLTQSERPPYLQNFLGFSLSGPIKKQKASFGFDFERRMIDENAFIYATTLDRNLNPVNVNTAIVTPQTRTIWSPRLDLTLNPNHTLTARYQSGRNSSENEGVGDYSLESRAYNQRSTDQSIQLTETAILSTKLINELRFQFMRTELARDGDNSIPALSVQGAFEGGGAQIGTSGNRTRSWELNNITTATLGTHTVKWGGRLRQSFLDDTSVSNFGGSYAFFGGQGPLLDANNLPIAGTWVQLSALERYGRTLLFQGLGLSGTEIRLLGGGASQFSLSAGTSTTTVRQFDLGLFANDDWRIRKNVTLSLGVRYEAQTNLSDWANWSPRLGIAWQVRPRTVIRTGFGIFYDRVSNAVTLNATRYDGLTQQSYLVQNPDFFPLIPSPGTLAGALAPQRLQLVDSGLQTSRNYQTTFSVEHQINSYARVSVQYSGIRGAHLQRSRNINTPLAGFYPYGDNQLRLLTESTGFSRSHMLIVSPTVNYKKLFLFGFYALSSGYTDAEGTPADPYNLRADWGPSSFMGVRHRMVLGTNIPMPWNISLSPFLTASSGSPYNVTIGRDLNLDGFTTERPALVQVDAAACAGPSLVYHAGYGCFNLNPAAGTAIARNAFTGPANASLNLRVARTWSFGSRGESGVQPGGGPGGPGGGPPPGGPPPGGGPGGGGPPPGGVPGGMFGASSSGRKYNLTLSASARNPFNSVNYSAPSGDLSSPYFGESRGLAGFGPFSGNTTYNRKIDIQLRFSF
ncbi:MAG: TonB-dependent receptor [Bryobacteraceae bacterium]|nr:TonB-dependent receptor [Bryobacteraceae bacterium]